MEQQKIGAFLKELRNEKGITQEQLAERLCVTGRTVSRWETGSNLPDLSLLVELAAFYDVDIRELINGERKSENMEKETKDTLVQVAHYANEEKKKLKKKMLDMSIGTVLLLIFGLLLKYTNGFGFIPQTPCENLFNFVNGTVLAVLGLNVLYFAGLFDKIYAYKANKRKEQL